MEYIENKELEEKAISIRRNIVEMVYMASSRPV